MEQYKKFSADMLWVSPAAIPNKTRRGSEHGDQPWKSSATFGNIQHDERTGSSILRSFCPSAVSQSRTNAYGSGT
jgi:hypothetical protein